MAQLRLVDAAYAQEDLKAAAILCFGLMGRMTSTITTYLQHNHPVIFEVLEHITLAQNATFPFPDILQGHFKALVSCCE